MFVLLDQLDCHRPIWHIIFAVNISVNFKGIFNILNL